MRKTITLAMAALMLLTAQCKKKEQKPEEMVMVPITGTVDFGGGSKTEITTGGYITPVSGDKIWIYYGGDYKGYMTCTPTTGQQFNCAGEIDQNCLGKECVFMYLGTGSKEADGSTAISSASSTISFADQTGIAVSGDYITGLDKFHVGSCIADVSAEGTAVLPMRTKMAIAYFQVTNDSDPAMPIANADVTISGHYSTATINKDDGTLTGNATGNITVHTDANGCFYMALIPQSDAVEFTFAATNYEDATNTFPNGIKANSYYCNQGNGSPIVVAMGYDGPEAPGEVTTTAGCNTEYIYTMGGTVTIDEAQQVEYGFVYSETATEPVPEIGKEGCTKFVGNTENLPVGTKSFTIDLTGLTVGTQYSVRAYAIGESGAAVHAPNNSAGIKTVTGGNVPQAVNWNGDPLNPVPGASPKEFSVSATTKVRFSQGNLQYIGSGSPAYWKFADHQFDYLGTKAGIGQSIGSQTVDRDLFGWGTSGQDHGAKCYQPWSAIDDYSYYYAYGSIYNHLYSQTPATADWGYNAITNGGNTVNGGWRTLTKDEWDYLLSSTNTSKWAYGKVGNCTSGLIILPDEWTLPGTCTFEGGKTDDYTTNVYTYTQWHDMESAGAVFLPAAGRRIPLVVCVGYEGYYWSSSYEYSTYVHGQFAYNLAFLSGYFTPHGSNLRYYGSSVRLVR